MVHDTDDPATRSVEGIEMGDDVFRMIFMLFALGAALAMFGGSVLLMNYGRRLGMRHMREDGRNSMVGLNAVEGAVFALLGLLLAFALSGALQRFDERRQLILQEANAIRAAYDRLDVLEGDARHELKAELKEYLNQRLELYRLPITFSISKGASVYSSEQQDKIAALRSTVWQGAVINCSKSTNTSACSLLLPVLTAAFDAALLRTGAAERHPPQIIYMMLFGLGLGGSLLAGFGMAASPKRSWMHILTFAAAMSIALYIITDIEFPRAGLIRVDYFDCYLEDLHDRMK